MIIDEFHQSIFCIFAFLFLLACVVVVVVVVVVWGHFFFPFLFLFKNINVEKRKVFDRQEKGKKDMISFQNFVYLRCHKNSRLRVGWKTRKRAELFFLLPYEKGQKKSSSFLTSIALILVIWTGIKIASWLHPFFSFISPFDYELYVFAIVQSIAE